MTSSADAGKNPYIGLVEITMRVIPSVSIVSIEGCHASATPLIGRWSFDELLSKNSDSVRLPRIHCASNVPTRVCAARGIWAYRCGKPGALLLRTIAVRIPGPHQRFSEPKPTTTGPAVSSALL